jgi:glycosyltransferase involved in cell wall biosynthesis
MHIGIAGPISLDLLQQDYWPHADAPDCYAAPITAFLVNALLGLGHRVSVFTTSWSGTEAYSGSHGALTVDVVPIRAHARRDMFRRERRVLASLIRQSQVDVVNAQWSYEFALAALASRRPTIVTLRDHAWTILRYSRDAYRLYRWMVNAVVVERAARLSVNSPYLMSCLAHRLQKKARILPNFLPQSQFQPRESNQSSSPTVLVTVANGFGPRKNMAAGLKAFAMVRRGRDDLTYSVIGQGMEVGGLAHRFAQANGIAEGVDFRGRLPYGSMVQGLTEATLMIHPSLEESFGMTVLEAMAAGVVTVAGSRSGNLPHLLDNGRCGRLCDVADENEISRVVTDLLGDRSFASGLATAARERALHEYSEQAVLTEYVRYYSDVAALGARA